MRRFLAILLLLQLTAPVWARDYGPAADVRQIRATVSSQFGHCANVSVSHDWAMCIANDQDNDLTILLHRVGGRWKVVAHDGGAYARGDLQARGVPTADIPNLLKTYQ